jgi:protein-S-isoprenylcysteine O-methyltransferase Ste14
MVMREFGLTAFGVVWMVLLAVAVLGQVLWRRGARRREAGAAYDLLVFVPFVLVFALASLPPQLGAYQGHALTVGGGALAAAAGLIGYLSAHLSLRGNWSISASVAEGQELVTTGLYARVRHPMYSAMVLITLGSGLLIDNYLMIVAAVPIAAVYYLRAHKEEALLSLEFPQYAWYVAKTSMFVPGVF